MYLPIQHLPAPLRPLVFLLVVLLAGRVILAWLPPGRLGGHALRELPSTLAACFVLDWAASRAVSGVARYLDQRVLLGAFLPLIAAAAVVRVLTLPATFVPTPPPRLKPAKALFVLIACACAAATFVYLLGRIDEGDSPSAGSSRVYMTALIYLALPALLDHALRELEVRPEVRLLVWLTPALLLAIVPRSLIFTDDVAFTPLLFGTGVAFAVVARMRADRRAAACSAIAFGALATCIAGWPLAAAGLVGLALLGPGASMVERAAWPLACAVLFAPWARILLDSRPAGATYYSAVAVPVVLFALPALFARGWRAARA